jgi:AcrR family transcriptional regulator
VKQVGTTPSEPAGRPGPTVFTEGRQRSVPKAWRASRSIVILPIRNDTVSYRPAFGDVVTITSSPVHSRPRVEGEREEQILDATVRLLLEDGYDRLTLDAVALEARASKATLYRRWSGKAEIVVDAIARTKRCGGSVDPDPGTLRGDLMAMACCDGGPTDDAPLSVVAGLMSAMKHDHELTRAIQERFLAPRIQIGRIVFERAQRRGEIDPDVDIELLFDVLPGMVMNRRLVLGKPVDDDFIAHVIDDVVLPAARRSSPAVPTHTSN